MSAFLSCPELSAQRIVLKPVESSDAHDFYELWTSDGLSVSGGFEKPGDLDAVVNSLNYFKNLNASGFYFKWSIRLCDTNEFLGELECYPLKPQIRPWMEWGLGYSLKKSAWGQGFMSEALARLLHFAFAESVIIRLKADVSTHNARSYRLLKKVGFLEEGIQSAKNFSNGQFNDMTLMAFTRERYLQEQQALRAELG